MRPDDYILEARSWVGTPFVHKGRTKGRAVDCIGLVYGAALALGLISDSLPDYARSPQGSLLEQSMKIHPALIESKELQPGDVLLFRFAKYSQHVGIYTGRNLIHSYEPLGGCIEHRYCDKWAGRKMSVFRFKDLT